MSTSVSLLAAHSYAVESLRPALETLLEPLGGITAFVKPGDRVLLKPNLLTGSRPGQECITRPELVACVAALVKEVGGKPFMGDSPAFGTARGVAENNGYLPLLEALDIPIVEFRGGRYESSSENFNHLRLSKEAMDADVVINLPKLKSHSQLTMTMGVKNLFGCVPGKMKAWWHMEAGKDADRFGEMLVETAKAIAPDLTILDSIIGHEGNGPMNGTPKEVGFLAAAADVFALDWVVTDILQIDPETIPTLRAQTRLGLTPAPEALHFSLAQPRDLLVENWKLPDALMPIDFGLPRVLRSTFKHFYIRFVKEPLHLYATKS
ncbi:MAG: DUF362 domain-containing protein [Synechocystis sp.]|jgi:uncharacterized protein (DUF362 family)